MGKAKEQSHGHTRSYFGEFDAAPLLDWLNRKDRPRGDPVEKLIRLDASVGDVRAMVLGNDSAKEIHATVAAVVRRYKIAVAPVVGSVAVGSWEVDWRLVGKMPPLQGLAFVKLLHLASRGVLDRIRQCKWERCAKWYFARFNHQGCCCARHQQNHVRATEQWKKHKREYMQRLRAEKKRRLKRQRTTGTIV